MPNRTKKYSQNMPLRIKSIRKKLHMTQKEFAELLNKGESTVRMWELGYSEPDSETIRILSEKSGKPTDYIIGKPYDLKIPMKDWRATYIEDYNNASEAEKEILKFEYGKGYFSTDDISLMETVDNEIDVYLTELKNRPEMKMLFSVAQNATKEDIEKAVKIIEALRGENNG